jgi:predicted MFS family arabinose efflux permease
VGWTDAQTLGLGGLSAVLLALFAAIEARSAAPLAPLRVLRSRALVGGNLVLGALGMLAFGMPFILTQYAQQVLGYSPLEFGLGSVVMPLGAIAGSVTAQAIATKGGVRAIVAVSMSLMGAGCLLLTQVSVGGSYLGDIFFGLLIFGPGLGAGYVAASIVSLAGVADADAGLASGLNNSAFQIGGAVGVAILSSVAVSQAGGSGAAAALTDGYGAAFTTAIAFAALGLLVAISLLGDRRARAHEPEAAVAPLQG